MNRSRENLPVTISADWHSPIISATIYLRVARRGSIIADVITLGTMTMEAIEFIAAVRRTPKMFVRPLNFDTLVAFINGFDVAHDSKAFGDEFHQWLCKLTDTGHNFVWSGVLLHITFPDEKIPYRLMNDEESNEIAVNAVFELASRFLSERDGP